MDDEGLLQSFLTTLNLDKILVAHDLLRQVKDRAGKSQFLTRALEEHADAVARCESGHERVRALLDEVNSDEGWKLEKKRGGTTVHSKREDGSPFITTKATTLIPVESKAELPGAFVRLVSLFAETDLMPDWFPNKLMHSNDTVHDISLFSKFTHMKFHPPTLAPISKRDGIAFGTGYDLTETGEIAIAYETLPIGEEFYGYTVPEPSSKYVRIEARGAFYLAVAEGGIVFKSLSTTDLKLNLIPTMVLNWLAKNGPFDYVSTVKKKFLNFEGSEWDNRVRTRPELYEDLFARVSASLNMTVSSIDDKTSAKTVEKTKRSSMLKRFSRKRKSKQRASRKANAKLESRPAVTTVQPVRRNPVAQRTQITDVTSTLDTAFTIFLQFLESLYESLMLLVPSSVTAAIDRVFARQPRQRQRRS